MLSDLLMIVLVLLFLLAGGRWLSLSDDTSPPSRIGRLAALALMAGLASITRYIGVELILLGAILIGFRQWKDHSAWDRARWNTLLREAGVFFLLSLLPLAAWMARNLLLTGLAFGPRAAPRWTVAENLAALGSGLEFWVRPLPLWGGLALLAAAALAGELLSRSAKQRLSRPMIGFRSPYAWPALLYGLLYLPLLVASQMSTAVTRIDQRLLAPAYFPFVMAVVLVLARLPAAAAGRKILPGVVSLLLFAAWLAPQGLTIYQTLLDSRAGGVSVYNYLNTRAFHDSGVTQYLRANPLPADAAISSNYAAVVFLYTGQHASASPFRRHPQNREIQYALESYQGLWPETAESYLIWYEGGLFEHYFPPQDLAGLADLIPLYQGPDGAVYRVIAKNSSQ